MWGRLEDAVGHAAVVDVAPHIVAAIQFLEDIMLHYFSVYIRDLITLTSLRKAVRFNLGNGTSRPRVRLAWNVGGMSSHSRNFE